MRGAEFLFTAGDHLPVVFLNFHRHEIRRSSALRRSFSGREYAKLSVLQIVRFPAWETRGGRALKIPNNNQTHAP
jgi:hypothetical protein